MSTRVALHTQERLQLEKEIEAAEAKKLWENQAPERAQVARALAQAKRDLRKRLLMDVNESIEDFQFPKYDGRFDAAEAGVVTKAIRDAWAEFISNHSELSSEDQTGVTMLLGLFGTKPDLAKSETFELALQYINTRLAALDPQPTANVSVPTESEPEPAPLKGRAREQWEKEQYTQQIVEEVFSSPIWSEFAQGLADGAGKRFSYDAQIQFFHYFSCNTRRYGVMTVQSLRKAAKDYWQDIGELTPFEQADIAETRVFEQAPTANDALRQLGIRKENHGADPSLTGYRALRV
jgi:hypothetical protein